jgi:hypothetical protein
MLYPKSFRDEYGALMLHAFLELRASSRRPSPAFWRFVVSDVVRSAMREQIEASRTGARAFAMGWLASCAIGLIATIVVANTVAWTLSYFYHPYFEGLTIPAWTYGACLGLVLGGTIGISQSMWLPRQRARAQAWALASGIALPIATLLCAAVVERTLTGVNPIAATPSVDAIGVLVRGLDQPKDWMDVTVPFVAMAVTGLTLAAMTARPCAEKYPPY